MQSDRNEMVRKRDQNDIQSIDGALGQCPIHYHYYDDNDDYFFLRPRLGLGPGLLPLLLLLLIADSHCCYWCEC